ncbi:MAG: HoxN/HupN/NixA family nickel/cobalt transporter, partial [Burkholderiales bacterium]
LFDDAAKQIRGNVIGIYALLIAGNFAAWAWALIAFHDQPMLLGLAFLAYSFGLRHAFDADHIAAIDNVTRKLMHEGQRPIAVGFFFSLGHSTIVVALVVVLAGTTAALQGHLATIKEIGGTFSTLASALFLFAIAAANIPVLLQVYKAFQAVKCGGRLSNAEIDGILANRGFLTCLLRPAFGLIKRSSHMYPLGVLFGLGFDTASEVGLLAVAAAQAAQGLSLWTILAFPALFTAGMSLMDTTDSTLMVGAYGWAFVKPMRKLYYNMTITFVSVIAALLIGGVEMIALMGGKLAQEDNFGQLGFWLLGLFVVSWIVSGLVYEAKGYDRVRART